MAENPLYIAQYQLLTPRQKNLELYTFYEKIPDFVDQDLVDQSLTNDYEWNPENRNFVHNQLQRRRNSQFNRLLLEKYQSLLQFAFITSSFNQHLTENYETCLRFGLSKKDPLSHPKYSQKTLFHNIEQNSSGIFEKSSAREIERKTYLQTIKTKMMFEDIFEQLYKEHNLPYRKYESHIDQSLIMVSAVMDGDLENVKYGTPEYQEIIEKHKARLLYKEQLAKDWPQQFYLLHQDEI